MFDGNITLDLIRNCALLLMAGLVYDLMPGQDINSTRILPRVGAGVVIGLVAIALMLTPVRWGDGTIFDTRTILLGLSGLYFGVVPTMVAMALAGAYRLYLGGGGVLMGIATILSSGLLGIAWRHYRLRPNRTYSITEIYVFGLASHLLMVLAMFLLPPAIIAQTLENVAPAVLLGYPLGAVMLGLLLGGRQKRRLITADLAKQKALFEALFKGNPDAIVFAGVAREVIAINPGFTSNLGYSLTDLVGKKTAIFYESTAEYERQGATRFNMTAADQLLPYEVNYRRKDGSVFPGETLGTTIKDGTGEILGYIGIIRDISERKEMARRLERATQLYATLSHINEAVVLASGAQELFVQVCDSVTRFGLVDAAWIGALDEAGGPMRPVARTAGPVVGCSDHLEVQLETSGWCPVQEALSQKVAIWCEDLEAAELAPSCRQCVKDQGWGSVAALPLHRGQSLAAMLVMYSRGSDAFDVQSRSVIEKMTANISFALGNFSAEATRLKAQADLQESEARYRALTNLSNDWYWEQDKDLRFTIMSRPDAGQPEVDLETFLGHSRRDAPGIVWDAAELADLEAIAAARKPFRNFEIGRTYRGGQKQYVRMSGAPIYDSSGVFTGYRGVGSNITERRKSEQQIRAQLKELQDWYEVTLGREDRVLQLKGEVNELLCELGRTKRYNGGEGETSEPENPI